MKRLAGGRRLHLRIGSCESVVRGGIEKGVADGVRDQWLRRPLDGGNHLIWRGC